MNLISSVRQVIAGNGGVINLAAKKRKLERELRASGLSRKEAMIIVSLRLRTRG